MSWQILVPLVLAVTIIIFPAVLIMYLNIRGLRSLEKERKMQGTGARYSIGRRAPDEARCPLCGYVFPARVAPPFCPDCGARSRIPVQGSAGN